MRAISIVCTSLVLWSCAAVAQTHPNLTGKWTLDPMRSRFDKSFSLKSATLEISHQEPKITIDINSIEGNGHSDYRVETTTDGVQTTQTLGGAQCGVKAEWGTRTGERLILELNCERPAGPVVTTREFKLGSKGKMITTVLTVVEKGKQKRAYEFYTKQPSS